MTSNSLTPSAERIVKLALEHFADRGYDASSLNEIALSAGIKKSSLYAHFTGKDELYISVLDFALDCEKNYVDAQFLVAKNDAIPGERYVDNIQSRFSESSALRFLLRAAFYPPVPIEQKVKRGFGNYLSGIGAQFQASLKSAHPDISSQNSDLLAEVYLALIESLLVELIYGNAESYSRRIGALRQLINILNIPLLEGVNPVKSLR